VPGFSASALGDTPGRDPRQTVARHLAGKACPTVRSEPVSVLAKPAWRPTSADRLISSAQSYRYPLPGHARTTVPRPESEYGSVVLQTVVRSVGGPHSLSEMAEDLATHDGVPSRRRLAVGRGGALLRSLRRLDAARVPDAVGADGGYRRSRHERVPDIDELLTFGWHAPWPRLAQSYSTPGLQGHRQHRPAARRSASRTLHCGTLPGRPLGYAPRRHRPPWPSSPSTPPGTVLRVDCGWLGGWV
jgi:hypothetical protein